MSVCNIKSSTIDWLYMYRIINMGDVVYHSMSDSFILAISYAYSRDQCIWVYISDDWYGLSPIK